MWLPVLLLLMFVRYAAEVSSAASSMNKIIAMPVLDVVCQH
jgi:hypothetical protein